jgi:uncharacterized membrane protein
MKKSRIESFSDGVFAIVITLLVLSIKIPDVSYSKISDGLLDILPSTGVYVLSFILIGMYWVFHHYSFSFFDEVDGVMVWLNIIFLLFISFLPFPTSLLGKYPFHTLPVLLYGINILLPNLIGFILIVYLNWNPQLASKSFTKKIFRSQMLTYLIVNGIYIIGLILAVYNPRLSLFLFGGMACYLIIRSTLMMGIGKCNLFNREKRVPV